MKSGFEVSSNVPYLSPICTSMFIPQVILGNYKLQLRPTYDNLNADNGFTQLYTNDYHHQCRVSHLRCVEIAFIAVHVLWFLFNDFSSARGSRLFGGVLGDRMIFVPGLALPLFSVNLLC